MTSVKNLIILVSAFTITGCATGPTKLPTFNSQGTLSVSSDPLSSLTDSGAGDYFVPNSQIMVGDAKNASNSKASSMFGMIGVGIAMSIDKSANHSAISNSGLDKPIKFDDIVDKRIKQAINDGKFGSFQAININQPSDLGVTPYARISAKPNQNAAIIFGYRVKFKNAANNNNESKRFYVFIPKNKYPIKGDNSWSSNDNLVFNQTATLAFNTLTEVLALDSQQKLDLSKASQEQQNQCQTDDTKHLTFIDSPPNLCLGVIKFKGRVLPQSLMIVEK